MADVSLVDQHTNTVSAAFFNSRHIPAAEESLSWLAARAATADQHEQALEWIGSGKHEDFEATSDGEWAMGMQHVANAALGKRPNDNLIRRNALTSAGHKAGYRITEFGRSLLGGHVTGRPDPAQVKMALSRVERLIGDPDHEVLAAELVAVRAELAEAREDNRLLVGKAYDDRTAREAAEQRIVTLAAMFGVPDGGRYMNDWRTRADRAEAAEADNQRLRDAQHWTRRMLQALDIYWEHYDGVSYKKSLTVRSESCSGDWWHRFEKYRARVEAALAGAAASETVFAWLIERGQPENHVPTVWLSVGENGPWEGADGWVEDANLATKFPTREVAEGIIDEKFTRLERSARAVEHGWLAEAAAATEEERCSI